MNIYTIIPAYNEKGRINEVVEKAKQHSNNVIVVDDGSDEPVKLDNVKILRHGINLGKGCAMKTGAEYAIRHGAEGLIFLDSDGQHLPEDLPKFINALNDYDIVFSYRKFEGQMPLIMRLGNKAISIAVQILYRIKLKDTQCGYRAFTTKAYEKLKWDAQDYSVETEMIVNTAKNKLKYTEVEVATIYQDKFKGTTVIDGMKIMINLMLWRFFKR